MLSFCAGTDYADQSLYEVQLNKETFVKKISYVLNVVLDLNTGFVVGLTKKKGPAFLLNKVTFPGGKVEDGETPEQAAHREMQEETGIDVPVSAFKVFEVVEGPAYTLTKLVALSSKVLYARAMEDEPVWHLAYARHLEYSLNQPDQYAPDFHSTLVAALACQGQTKERVLQPA